MQLLPQEIEERYGAARGLVIPTLVSSGQLDILRADERNAAKVWQVPMLVYAGARLVCQTQPHSGYLRPLQFSLPNTILDVEDFAEAVKEAALTNFGLKIEIGHYLLMAQITFMIDNPEVGEDAGTASRTLHLFTAHTSNLEKFLVETAASPDRNLKLVKPTELNAALEAEWNELKARRQTHTKSSLISDYNDAWVFVYTRLLAQAFHHLFGWPLPAV